MNEKIIKPIGIIQTNYKEKFGIPRQSGRVSQTFGIVKLLDKYNTPDSIRGIEDFSHIILIFGFNKAKENSSPLVRPPRLGGNKKVGVFASRSPFRPNGLGISIVKLENVKIENNDVSIVVSGIDILDKTPIYDIKPYIPSSDKIENAVGGYSEEFTNYKLNVIFPIDLQTKIEEQHLNAIIDSLKDDPRPSYHKDGKVYGMKYANYNIKFSVENKTLTVMEVETY